MVSYWEWMGEDMDPGGRGSVTIRWGLPERRSGWPTLTYGLIAALALGWGVYLIHTHVQIGEWQIMLAIIAGYLLVGYMIRPEADHDNLGWGGGMFNNPFRWSDDLNRWLLLIMLALWPARFISEGLIGLLVWPFRSADADDEYETE